MNFKSSFTFFKKIFCSLLLAAVTPAFCNPIAGAKQETPKIVALDFVDVAKKATPAVVSIRVKAAPSSFFFHRFFDREEPDFFSESFRHFFGLPKPNEKKPFQDQTWQASGFIVSDNGYILTNEHVVADAKEITVMLVDGREFPAKVIGKDKNTDIAVLKIDAEHLPYLKLANSDELQPGQWAIAIGNPLGLQASLTVGVISATGRDNLDLATIEDFIQTDATINQGNSGGPLLDMKGEVVGINTAIVNYQNGYTGIGFAIPSNIAQNIMDQLISNGSATRGFIGVALQKIDQNLAQSFGLSKVEGALISEVTKGSPADKAGLSPGDIVLKYNNHPVANIAALHKAIFLMKPGSKLTLTVLREGKMLAIPIEVAKYPEHLSQLIAADNKLGLEVENLTPEFAHKVGISGLKGGLLVTQVRPGSPAYNAGIRPGAILVAVNQHPVTTIEEFQQNLKESDPSKPILFLIKQGGFTRFVSIKVNY
ncbi:DegQ family serine endoprotease [Parachlamydia sp. AcF125]|uniref:DegQ family serine endoprotease n=1 Tax=Parachlamydia sp. AcF125 TaxID=2795736 RepID=UPI001BCA6483|nr:DegQ family serine endoprotease [Parachlamydia sp. AcF125]MBS4167728.1 Periplasmic pH-dependent serine endoprotease DegQ [Parachlamydia sp. AcF125]